jgi:shikimate kinase
VNGGWAVRYSGARSVRARRAVIVLLGAPGSGKSVVGASLGALGFRWRGWEPEIVARWGSREAFVARKDEALPALHAEIRRWVAAPGGPAVVESTGLSDAPLLDALGRSHSCFTVRLDVSQAAALRRVAERERGRHLSDDAERNRAVWHAFAARVAGVRPCDLVVDTESAGDPAAIAAAVERAWRLSRA